MDSCHKGLAAQNTYMAVHLYFSRHDTMYGS